MKLADIKPGRWYATSLGIGECIEVGAGKPNRITVRINGHDRIALPRDVYGEAKKPEVTP